MTDEEFEKEVKDLVKMLKTSTESRTKVLQIGSNEKSNLC